MPSSLQVALLIFVPTALFAVLLRIPHWFCRSLFRHRLWQLRDSIVDDIRYERLPRAHPAVREVRREVELALRETGSFTMLTFYVWAWVWRRAKPEVRQRLRYTPAPMTGLLPKEQTRLEQHRERLHFLHASTILLGTWVGIATILRFVVPALREASRSAFATATLATDVRITLRDAADRASTESWLGRSTRERVAEPDDGPLTGVAS